MFSLLSFTVKSLCNSKYTQKRLNTLRIHFSFSKIICKVWLSPSSCLTFSPVIKVGKAEDANVNTHTAASDSDEEFQLHASVSSKRIKSNLFWSNDKVSKRPVFKTFPANVFVSGNKNYITIAANSIFFSEICLSRSAVYSDKSVRLFSHTLLLLSLSIKCTIHS